MNIWYLVNDIRFSMKLIQLVISISTYFAQSIICDYLVSYFSKNEDNDYKHRLFVVN